MSDRRPEWLPALPDDGLLGRMQRAARRLPGASIAAEVYNSLEDIALHELKSRLDRLDADNPQMPDDTATSLSRRIHPGLLLKALLEESAEQKKDDARRSLFTSMLLELTPDEASLLATLSDGYAHALVHVTTGNALGGISRVASNFSTVGKAGPVKLKECTPAYIDHLRSLGLAETRPEDKSLEIKYQIVEGDPAVQKLVKELKSQGRQARFQRRTLVISELGRELWAYCDPDNITD